MSKKVQTAVIGSYPIQLCEMEFMRNYFNQTKISWQPYIDEVVSDMIESGVDLVSDGQTRDPFIELFARKLKGCRIRARPEIIDSIAFTTPITVDDQQYLKKKLPDSIEVIGVLTGPYTLTRSCVDFYYHDEKKAAIDFAKALNKEAVLLQKYVSIISFDEPFFSNHFPKYAKELYKIITKDISLPIRLHVCGDVSSIVSDLLEMPVDMLSHEFKASSNLLESFNKYTITKDICLGCVRSDHLHVESVEEICDHIQKATEVFGDKIAQIAPDCGLRMLPRDIALQKLKNLVQAGEKMYG
jgi:5-methyltetrahydropteroyltriglutamate--homocysteine methyltransferase